MSAFRDPETPRAQASSTSVRPALSMAIIDGSLRGSWRQAFLILCRTTRARSFLTSSETARWTLLALRT